MTAAHESKTIQAQSVCTNVPKPAITVGEALAVLRIQTKRKTNAKVLRRTLLELLAAIDDD